MCHATCPLGLNQLKVGVGAESGDKSRKLGREPMDAFADPTTLAAHSDAQPVRSSLRAALPLQSKRVVLLWLLGVPMAAAASLPSDLAVCLWAARWLLCLQIDRSDTLVNTIATVSGCDAEGDGEQTGRVSM